jgi:hypothetical protein
MEETVTVHDNNGLETLDFSAPIMHYYLRSYCLEVGEYVCPKRRQ